MSENESGSKKERKFYDLSRDRLSELPSGIIDIILSFLPIRDAVRTSILSKQYRYKWISLPHLVFDLSHFNYPQCQEKFLLNVLKRHKGPIHKFGMSAGMEKSWPIVEKWLISFHKNEIRELFLKLGSLYNRCYVGSVAYSCNKLTRLELHRCELGPPPLTFTGFLFLRCLILVNVNISSNDVGSIVANSPLIETLKLDRIWSDIEKPELRINAPNLKYFDLGTKPGVQIYFSAPFLAEMCVSVIYLNDYYLGENRSTRLELDRCELGPPPLTFTGFLFLRCLILVDVKISLSDVESIVANSPLIETLKLNNTLSDIEKPVLRIDAPNLKYFDLITKPSDCMQIHFSAPFLAEMCVSVIGFNDGYLRENRSSYNYTNFFGGCSSLQRLKGNYFTKVMSYGVDSCRYSFVLPCLEVIELSDVKFGVVEHMSIVARLVTGAPNLQKLDLTCDPSKEKHTSEAPDVSYTDFLRAPDFKWEKLRIITMRNLTGLPTEMEFLRLLLENSPVLERVNLYTKGLNFQESENLRAKVFKCNLASPNITLWDILVI